MIAAATTSTAAMAVHNIGEQKEGREGKKERKEGLFVCVV